VVLRKQVSRREFLAMGAALAAGAASLSATCVPPAPWPAVPQPGRSDGLRHLSWVWQFSHDGPPEQIVSLLAQYNLGVLLKTHDGTEWMSTYDASPYAVWGPGQVSILANYFESYGVPFHAWCVVKGLEPLREAEMCAQVVGSGARSVTVDLEPHAGFWQGTPEAALTFGQELRKRQPGATLYASIDPRPWVLARVPLKEFASFSQGFAPQIYWETFNSSDNAQRFEASGFPLGASGITPEFLLEVSRRVLQGYGPMVHAVGQGASTNLTAWSHFVGAARTVGIPVISVWRHGVTSTDVWRLLRDGGTLPSPTPGAGLSKGVTAVVADTDTCLNVRDMPSTGSPVRACLPDGTVVVVRDGPVAAEGYRWWLIEAQAATGWSAEAGLDGVRWLVPLPA
jgi:hypothetical protein